MENEFVEIDLSEKSDKYPSLMPGKHFAKIISCQYKVLDYMKGPNFAGTGKAIEWKYETFGSPTNHQNHKHVFQSTPLDGNFRHITARIIKCALPDLADDAKGFKPSDCIGKLVEIEVEYRANKFGVVPKYPSVFRTYPYVESGSAGSLKEEISFEGYNPSGGVPF